MTIRYVNDLKGPNNTLIAKRVKSNMILSGWNAKLLIEGQIGSIYSSQVKPLPRYLSTSKTKILHRTNDNGLPLQFNWWRLDLAFHLSLLELTWSPITFDSSDGFPAPLSFWKTRLKA